MSYNGWRNYETWNLALWLHNERLYYDNVMLEIEVCLDAGMSKEEATDELCHYIDNMVQETIDHYGMEIGGWLGDWIVHYIDDLDITSIAKSFLEDYDDRKPKSNAKAKRVVRR